MKRAFQLFVVLSIFAPFSVALGGAMESHNEAEALQKTRACIPSRPADVVSVSVSGTSAETGALDYDRTGYMVCTTEVRWRSGGGSAPTAVATDPPLPERTYFPFSTSTSVNAASYVNRFAFITTGGTGTCWVILCQ